LLPLSGAVPLAPSFDTVGIMSTNATDLSTVANVMWGANGAQALPPRPDIDVVHLAIDAVDRASAELQSAMDATASRLSASGVRVREVRLEILDEVRETQAPLQGAEAWAVHKPWIEAMSPKIGDDVSKLLTIGAGRSTAELDAARAERARLVRQIDTIVGEQGALLLPAALGVAPAVSDLDDADRSLAYRRGMLSLHNIATLGGLPAIAFPIQAEEELPLGAQLVGPRGGDRVLLDRLLAMEQRPRS
jgi:amidase